VSSQNLFQAETIFPKSMRRRSESERRQVTREGFTRGLMITAILFKFWIDEAAPMCRVLPQRENCAMGR
jgi:hypothetical protein